MFLSSLLVTLVLCTIYMVCLVFKAADIIIRQYFISALISFQITIVIYYLSRGIV